MITSHVLLFSRTSGSLDDTLQYWILMDKILQLMMVEIDEFCIVSLLNPINTKPKIWDFFSPYILKEYIK